MATGTVIRTESRIVLVDAVVTDKKGKYVPDLTQQDFKVFEDNKEQAISSFSFGSDPTVQVKGQQHYMILFFDNSSMQAARPNPGAQCGRQVHRKERRAGPLDGRRGFWRKPDRQAELHGERETPGGGCIGCARAEHRDESAERIAARDCRFARVFASAGVLVHEHRGIRILARAPCSWPFAAWPRTCAAVPGRKMLVLFSAGFPLDPERMSELTATIDACNKANVAVYSVDVRGLIAGVPGGSARIQQPSGMRSAHAAALKDSNRAIRPRLVMASYSLARFHGSPEARRRWWGNWRWWRDRRWRDWWWRDGRRDRGRHRRRHRRRRHWRR